MTITTVTYTKTFNLGNYSSEKIGVEISINEGENAMEALDAAKQLVHEYYIKGQDDLHTMPIDKQEPIHFIAQPLPEIQVEKEHYSEQTLEEQIATCNDTKTLEAYKFLVKKDPKLQLEYDKRMYILKELSPKK